MSHARLPLPYFTEASLSVDRQDRQRVWAAQMTRLRRWVAGRLGRQLGARLDPSDVVQETMMVADRRYDAYLKDPKLPLFPWLCRIALGRIRAERRRHVQSQKRTIFRERRLSATDSRSVDARFAAHLAQADTSPSGRAARQQGGAALRDALSKLAPKDRRILELRYFDQRSFAEVASILGVSEGAAKVRHFRALERIREYIADV
jgi:RNA polymerase sigma-70 factor (ECF subfamily)